MQENYSEYRIPSFNRRDDYLYEEATHESYSIYQELNAIAEELERCRAKNS